MVSSNHSRFETLEAAVVSVSNRIVNTCLENGGVAKCDDNFVNVGVIDERVLTSYELPVDVIEFGKANRMTFRVAFDNERNKGVSCVIRLLKHADSNREVRMKVCGE